MLRPVSCFPLEGRDFEEQGPFPLEGEGWDGGEEFHGSE